MPNQEQVMSAIRWILTTIGPILIGHGYTSDSTLTAIGGAVLSLVPLIWSMIDKTQTSLISKVAAMPEVTKVVTINAIANGTLKDDAKVTTS